MQRIILATVLLARSFKIMNRSKVCFELVVGSLLTLCAQASFEQYAPKSRDEQKKGHNLRRCSKFGSTSSDEQNKVTASAYVPISARNQKKTSSRPQAVVELMNLAF